MHDGQNGLVGKENDLVMVATKGCEDSDYLVAELIAHASKIGLSNIDIDFS